jgi:dTDP-4-dehydrorhamnose 3,5-epimerase
MSITVVHLDTSIEGPVLLEPTVFEDERGFFQETFNEMEICKLGIPTRFVQDNQSRSKKGVLRGLHFQKSHPQAKLIRVTRGEVYDIIVDLRAGSPTLGEWCSVSLSAKNMRILFVPEGFAHGFLALSENVDLCYKCSDYYDPEDQCGLIWNDPDLAIPWPLEGRDLPLLSSKDASLKRLANMDFGLGWTP